MRSSPFLLALALLVVACGGFGGSVDSQSPSFVDQRSAGSIDAGLPPLENTTPVLNETTVGFVPPPGAWVANATISIDEKQNYFGRDVAKLWIWNERGSANLLIPEGTGVSHGGLKVSVSIPVIGLDSGEPRVQLIVAGQSAILRPREETLLNGTWVLLSDVFLSSAESRS